MTYLKPDICQEPSQRFKIEFFAKIVRKYHCFSKVLQSSTIRYMIDFQMPHKFKREMNYLY